MAQERAAAKRGARLEGRDCGAQQLFPFDLVQHGRAGLSPSESFRLGTRQSGSQDTSKARSMNQAAASAAMTSEPPTSTPRR